MKKSILITTAAVVFITCGTLAIQEQQSMSLKEKAVAMAKKAKAKLKQIYRSAEETLGVYVENVSASYTLKVKDVLNSTVIKPGDVTWVAVLDGGTITVAALNNDGTPVIDSSTKAPLIQKITRVKGIQAYQIEVGKLFTNLTFTCSPSNSTKICVKPLDKAAVAKEIGR